MTRVVSWLTFGTALGCGINAGVFFAFSSFVMPGLSRLPAAQGIAAMQAINVAAVSRWFMLAFLGTGVACVILAGSALADASAPGAWLRLAGCALYLLGPILVTVVCNVPRNDALAELLPESPEAVVYWARYVAEWSTWNHVRAVGGVAASGLLILGNATLMR